MTDRCNYPLRRTCPRTCGFSPAALLSSEEIERVTRVAVPLGIDKVRAP